ncbi:MAG TPA: hypothetical protein VH044_11595 [Polyangiaceae bacterium]|jgi:hypothetical protein|nr:hypothetical protein [Polyangiaceae bacterium]
MRPFAAVVVHAAVVFIALAAASSASAQDLQAPPPLSASSYTPPSSNTSDQSQDSGLGLEWVYLNADVGGAYTNMRSFSESNLALNETSSGGAALGLAAGVRLLFFTLGVRARDLLLSNYNLWELDGEAAFHVRVWRIDPYFGVRGGYAFVGSLGSGVAASSSSSSAPDVTVHGFNVGPMVGLDVYISSLVSIGVDANAEVLFLKRPPAPLPAGVTPAEEAMLPAQEQELYKLSGSSIGFGAIATAHVGIHF